MELVFEESNYKFSLVATSHTLYSHIRADMYFLSLLESSSGGILMQGWENPSFTAGNV